MADTAFLYTITSPNNRIYVGQTIDPKKRFMVYARNAIPGQHRLRESISKYGWGNHKTQVITELPLDQIDYAEKYLIAYYDSTGKDGLNILEGGQIRLTKDHYKRHSQIMRGRKHSQERKYLAAIRMMGNNHALGSIRTENFKNNLSKKVQCYKNGILIKEYKRLEDVRNDGLEPSCVSKSAKGIEGRKQHKGMTFKFI